MRNLYVTRRAAAGGLLTDSKLCRVVHTATAETPRPEEGSSVKFGGFGYNKLVQKSTLNPFKFDGIWSKFELK